MKYLLAIGLGALIGLSGCVSEPTHTSTAGTFTEWPPEMSLADARGLTPDECKAILVARAVLEGRQKSEIHARFRVVKQRGEWRVTAFYTAPAGGAVPPGGFTGVVIAPDGSVKQIIGGA